MKLQDLHPYDSFIVGIHNIYYIDYKGDFHINAPFIIALNKTLSTGSTYVLIESFNTKNYIVRQVRLQDAYYSEGTINLLVEDIVSMEAFAIDQRIKCTRGRLKWILIDLEYLVEELNSEFIKSYCGSCVNTKKHPDLDNNHKDFTDDLLEFDF